MTLMLAHHDLNDISIDTYEQEILPILLLADDVYITCSFKWLRV